MALVLGIDVGTTAVKCALVDAATRAAVASAYVASREYVDCGDAHAEQRVEAILIAVAQAIQRLPLSELRRVTRIGICGQMHGIVWWRSAQVAAAASSLLTGSAVESPPWSRLVTWEDQRCSSAFIEQCEARVTAALEKRQGSSSRLASGYGLATYVHILQRDASSLNGYDACGTIHDLLAFILCGHTTSGAAVMDTTDAFSWGAYDGHTRAWNWQSVDALGIRREMLPTIKAPGTVVGQIPTTSVFMLPSGADVFVPMGDHPCSVVAATAQFNQDATASGLSLVNIGTSAQLAMVLPVASASMQRTCNRGFELRPFVTDHQVLGVAAARSGGNMFAWLMQRCREWMAELLGGDAVLTEDVVNDRLIALGLEKLDTTLQIRPTLNGERGDPNTATGVMHSLQLHNASLGDLSAALCRGLIQNLVGMVPSELLPALRSNRMIGTGSALTRNRILQYYLEKTLASPTQLELHGDADAAVGAALGTLHCLLPTVPVNLHDAMVERGDA